MKDNLKSNTKFIKAIEFIGDDKFSEAIELLEPLLKEGRWDNDDLTFRLSSCYFFTRQVARAKSGFQQVVKMKPEFEAGSLGLYLCHVEMEEGEKAIGELERFVGKFPPIFYKDTLADLLVQIKDGNMPKFKKRIENMASLHKVTSATARLE